MGEEAVGVSPKFIAMMERFNVSGHGASFGYPTYVHFENSKKRKEPSDPIWQRLNVTVEYYDVGPLPPHDIRVLDLNDPLPDELVGRYDFLIVPGTYECVWNIAQAWENGYRIVKPGGLQFLHGSISRPKQGYWQQTEQTLKAWCNANGAEMFVQEFDGQIYDAVVRTASGPLVTPQENNVR